MQSLFSAGQDAQCGTSTSGLKQLTGLIDRDRSVAQNLALAPQSGLPYRQDQIQNLPFRLVNQHVRLAGTSSARPIQVQADLNASSANSEIWASQGPSSRLPSQRNPDTKGKARQSDDVWQKEFEASQRSRSTQSPSRPQQIAQADRTLSSGKPGKTISNGPGLLPVNLIAYTNLVPFGGPAPVIHQGLSTINRPDASLRSLPLHAPFAPTHLSGHVPLHNASQTSETARDMSDLRISQGDWDSAEEQAAAYGSQQAVARSLCDVLGVPAATVDALATNGLAETGLEEDFQAALTMLDEKLNKEEEDLEWGSERDVMYPCFPMDSLQSSQWTTSAGWNQADIPSANIGLHARMGHVEGSAAYAVIGEDAGLAGEPAPEGDDFDQDTFNLFYGTLAQAEQPSTGSAVQSHLDMQTTGMNMTLNLMLDGLDLLDEALSSIERENGYPRSRSRPGDRMYPLHIARDQPFLDVVSDLEAALYRDGADAHKWLDLGQAQQANERDDLAIAAYRHCITLEPACTPAYLGLATAYTNEGNLAKAYGTLETWLRVTGTSESLKVGDLLGEVTSRSDRHEALVRNLVDSISRRGNRSGEDLQVAFGIILNASQEYDKASDCFRYASRSKPEDPRLLNTLGATLANGGRPAEALECYQSALELDPGYIRAHFNCGVSYMQMGRYEEAVDFLVDALRLQAAQNTTGSDFRADRPAFSNIWSTLESACGSCGYSKLLTATSSRDLNGFEAGLAEIKMKSTTQPVSRFKE